MANTQSLHALLDQTGWIHALARKLVSDPHLAADLAQDACVQALEHQPDGSRPLRGWLATVMRNQLAKLRRGDQGRRTREQEPRGEGLAPDALDVVEKAETHRNVVLAVLALDEPTRSTLLMRFFEQLSYDEIAARTNVTRAAVNSRITRGLAELRARLEQAYGGDRRALGLALLPLAKLPTGLALPTLLGLKTMHVVIGTATAALLVTAVSVGTFVGREARQPASAPAPALAASRPEEVEMRVPLFLETSEPVESGRIELAQEPHQRERVQTKPDPNRWTTEVYQAFAMAPTVESLAVNTGSGDIEVNPSTSGRLEIKAKVTAELNRTEANQRTQLFEDHVKVVEEDGVLRIEDNHHDSRGWSVSFVVSVPRDLPLGANSGSGDVILRVGQSKVKANSGSGDVRVELANEHLQSLGANTGSGKVLIEVASIEGHLDANSGSGDVLLLVVDPSSPGSARLSTGSGDVCLFVPANVVGSFELETFGGEVALPPSFGIQTRRDVSGARSAEGALGSGGGAYQLRSGSGDLRVEIASALPR